MLKEIEYIGDWWLPDKPDEKFSGILRFVPGEEIILKLIDASGCHSSQIIKNALQIMSRASLDPEIILGRCHDGKEFKDVTLYQCFQTHSNVNLTRPEKVGHFSPAILFVGCHFRTPEDIKFRKLSIFYSQLTEWIRGSEWGEVSKTLETFTPIFTNVVDVATPGGYKIVIGTVLCPSATSSIGQREFKIIEKTYVRIEAEEYKSFLQEFQEIESYVRGFFSFWLSRPIYPLCIQGEACNGAAEAFVPQKILTKSRFSHRELSSFNNIRD
ncbi:MAG: hypothetical protein J3T61_05145, partial [Candidatus Brocadiales bacterium]|nr:hypothetical protein [Candidatus Bathyanammoxibius sp.]